MSEHSDRQQTLKESKVHKMAQAMKRATAAAPTTAADTLEKALADLNEAVEAAARHTASMVEMQRQADASLADAEAHAALGRSLYAAQFEAVRLDGMVARARAALPPLEREAKRERRDAALKHREMLLIHAKTRGDAFVKAYRMMNTTLTELRASMDAGTAAHAEVLKLSAELGEAAPEALRYRPVSETLAHVATFSFDERVRSIIKRNAEGMITLADAVLSRLLFAPISEAQLLGHLVDLYELPAVGPQEFPQWTTEQQLAAIRRGPAAYLARYNELSGIANERAKSLRQKAKDASADVLANTERQLARTFGFAYRKHAKSTIDPDALAETK